MIALILACSLIGFCLGFILYMMWDLFDAKCEIQSLNQQVLDLTEELAVSRCEARAHETSLNMVLEKVTREDHEAS